MTRPKPYLQRDPGDVIRSGDWNEIQIQAREELHSHNHSGADGLKIPRQGIEPHAIDGSLIDPATKAEMAALAVGEMFIQQRAAIKGKLHVSDSIHTGHLSVDQSLSVGKRNLLAELDELHKNKLSSGGAIHGDLRVNGNLIANGTVTRRIAVATGLGPTEQADSGRLMSRTLNFTKAHAESAVRILYCDNLRVYGNHCSARWEVRVNGQHPPSGPIWQYKYTATGSGAVINQHEPDTIIGYAGGLPPGKHQIEIWLANKHFNHTPADCCTGWPDGRWTIEAEEVWI